MILSIALSDIACEALARNLSISYSSESGRSARPFAWSSCSV